MNHCYNNIVNDTQRHSLRVSFGDDLSIFLIYENERLCFNDVLNLYLERL